MSDRYQIISLIEEDQLGSVYLARDTTLQRKVIFRSFIKAVDGKRSAGFEQYTGKLCALQHPNLLTIYDISSNDDGYFMVTQLLDGESLEARLKKGALNQVGVHNMACDLLDALHAAHTSGLFHGAMRTDSIIRLARVRGGHRYMIVDFGKDRLSAMLSGSYVVMADPVLMAPELVGSRRAPDGASDLFTLGQLCYISLVGGHPYAGKSSEECAHAYRDGGLPHLSAYVQGVQDDFADWVMWLVSGSAEDRPFSSQEAMKKLHAIKLRTPSPNVAGVTEAVDVPISPDPRAPKISERVNVVAPRPTRPKRKASTHRVVHVTEASGGNRLIIAAAGVIILLLMVLVGILVFKNHSLEVENLTFQHTVPKKKMVILKAPQYISQIIAQRESVSIPLDTKGVVDWTVITGVPAPTARVLMKGGTSIRNILVIGEFSEFVSKHKMVTYTAGKTVISPQRCVTNSKKGDAKEGEGWEVYVFVPEGNEGPLMVTLYMIQNQCDFNIEVRSTHEKNKDKIVKLNVPKKNPGIVKIPILIPKPAPGYYSIRVLSSSVNATTGFEMGLSAVLVSRPQK